MLQKLCILALGYAGYRLWKKVRHIDDRVTDNTVSIVKLKEERASE